ncbi:PcfJ domain-containing protein [Streptomyces sp. NBC_00838]|uniref:PcfJ domain-containing protein n=1 Tax=Streptomyces sp. NBC_00838 TaxID=2903680 RepID=UPI003864F243|nr:PcfJ domain-containing protein [Streptomyces sp. NBC_00838]
MPERTEHALLYIKYVDDARAEQGAAAVEGAISGMSLRILARTLPDGRTSVAVSLYRRVHRMRASGKVCHYWTHEKLTSMARTKKDLVVLREIDRRQGKSTSRHVFSVTAVESWIHELSWTLLRWVHSHPQARRLEGPEPQGVDSAVDRAIIAIREHIGELPNWDDRFPLLQDDRQYRPDRPASAYLPYLDCHNHAQVAKNLFGVRAYRRPLAREVERLDISTLNWFAMFRGLVPVDWLIDAMRTTETAGPSSLMYPSSLTSLQQRGIRSILRRTPQPVLRRILNEPVHQARRTLADAANCTANRLAVTRDLDLLPEMIAARGQRRVRDSRDLEHLVRDLPAIERWHDPRGQTALRAMQEEAYALREMEYYNHEIRLLPEGTAQIADWNLWKDEAFRAQALALIEDRRRQLMAVHDRERHERAEARRFERIASQAQRHQWALRTAALLDGREAAPGLSFVVARDAETLSRWGAMLNNCIGGYADELGLDVFVAVCEADGLVRLNLQITQSHGVEQILGKYNRDAVRELGAAAQQVVDGLGAMEISFHSNALGMDGLRLPQRTH